jgi:methionyl-tRNA formyltransferase
VRQVQWHKRADRALRKPCREADVLLNFLSAPLVARDDLDKFGQAINFHPAPPEYPGVGSASLALYDRRTTHGVTAHLMTPRYDDGLILRVRRFPIYPDQGYESVFDRALDECLALFREVVQAIASGEPLRTTDAQWSRRPYTRKEFESHPSFASVPK